MVTKYKDSQILEKELAEAGLSAADQPSSTSEVVKEIIDACPEDLINIIPLNKLTGVPPYVIQLLKNKSPHHFAEESKDLSHQKRSHKHLHHLLTDEENNIEPKHSALHKLHKTHLGKLFSTKIHFFISLKF